MKKTTLIILTSLALMSVPLFSFADVSDASLLAHLSLGSHGAGVTRLQTLLAADASIYPEGLITGYYGSLTQKAVIRLQQKNGLQQVGFVGPKTLALLLALGAPQSTPTTQPVPSITTSPPAPAATAPTSTPVTPPAPASTDTTAPLISYIAVSGLGSSNSSLGTVSWSTNEMATSKVYISTSTPLQIGSATAFASSTLIINHVVNLTGLTSHTTYYYVLESADASGNTTRSAQNYFSTSY